MENQEEFNENKLIPKTRVTTTINSDLWKEAMIRDFSWQKLLEFAIKFKIADKDGFDYPVCDLREKLFRISKLLNEKNQELEDIKNPKEKKVVDPILDNEIKKEMEEAFGQ